MLRSRLGFLALATLLCHCGDDSPPAQQGGPPGQSGAGGEAGQAGQAGQAAGGQGGSDTTAAPFQIAPPALPVFTPCPAGWTERALDNGPTVCDPGPLPDWTCPAGWLPRTVAAGTPQAYEVCEPPELPDSCPAGQMAVVGQSGCQPLGEVCPAGDWPEGLPSEAPVVYVKAGAAAGGNGSKTSPYATISAGVLAAKAGGIVAVAKGTYAEKIILGKKHVTVWGACAASVTVQGPAAEFPSGTVVVSGGELGLRNVVVTGNAAGLVASGAKLDLRGVEFKQAMDSGIYLEESEMALEGVRVSGTQSNSKKLYGIGLWLSYGSKASGHRVQFDGNRSQGVLLSDHSSVTLERVLIDGTLPSESSGSEGQGMGVFGGSTASVNLALISRNHGLGVEVAEAQSQVMLTDVSVRDTLPFGNDKSGGYGIQVVAKATLQGHHLTLSRNRSTALRSNGDGSKVMLTQSLVEQTIPGEGSEKGGDGVLCTDGASCTIEGTAFVDNTEYSVGGDGKGTQITLRDSLVRDTQASKSKAKVGVGLSVTGGASGLVERSLLASNLLFSLGAFKPGTKLLIKDVVIEDNRNNPETPGDYGAALAVRDAEVQSHRLRINGPENFGVFLNDTPDGTSLTDGVITGREATDPAPASNNFGLVLSGAAHLKAERLWLARNRSAGIVTFGEAKAQLADVTVLDSDSDANASEYGMGIAALDDTQVQLDRVVLDNNQNAGLMVSGDVTAHDLRVTSTRADRATGTYGFGIMVQQGRLQLERTHVHENHAAALVGLLESQITLKQAWLTNTQEGSFLYGFESGVQKIEGVSDGMLLLDGSQIEASNVLIQSCARAGVVFAGSQGSLDEVTVRDAEFSLVLRDNSNPSISPSCDFQGDSQAGPPDGNLPIPNQPLSTPVPPLPPQ